MQITIRTEVMGNKKLSETIILANKACQYCINEGFKHNTFNKTKLHNFTYRKIRKKYPLLNSSYVTATRDQASDMLKRLKLKKRPIKKVNGGIRLNHNTFKVFFDTNILSISTNKGRQKYNIAIPRYFKEKYVPKKATAGTIRFKDNRYFLNITIDIDTPKIIKKPKKIIGIDRGAYNPIVTSDNQFFNSKKLREVKSRYKHLKRCFQQKGTRSALRHLKKISGRERRFVRDTNHCISKHIVESDCEAIAFEKLNVAAMKMRKKRGRAKKNIALIGSWSPTELLTFVSYKAQLLGKRIILVNSHYTSQACNRCGYISRSNRNGSVFKCIQCSYTIHSDLNAARNIAALAKGKSGRLPINQPIVACDDLKASLKDELRASIVTSSAI